MPEKKDANSTALEVVERLLSIQGMHGNWDFDPYMHGLYNGLALAVSIMRGDDRPDYKDAPEHWLCDRKPGMIIVDSGHPINNVYDSQQRGRFKR